MSAVESLKLDSSRAATCVKKQPNTNRAGGQRSTMHRRRETSTVLVLVFMIQEVKCEHKNKTFSSSSKPQSVSLQVRPSSSSSSSVQCVYIRNKVNNKNKYRLWHHSTSRVTWHSLGWAAPTLIKVSKLILPINTFKKSFILKLLKQLQSKRQFLKNSWGKLSDILFWHSQFQQINMKCLHISVMPGYLNCVTFKPLLFCFWSSLFNSLTKELLNRVVFLSLKKIRVWMSLRISARLPSPGWICRCAPAVKRLVQLAWCEAERHRERRHEAQLVTNPIRPAEVTLARIHVSVRRIGNVQLNTERGTWRSHDDIDTLSHIILFSFHFRNKALLLLWSAQEGL